MNRPGKRDWDLINAYHDGALDPVEARHLEGRIGADPALQAALQDVADISRSLGALRPLVTRATRPEPPGAANDDARPARWLTGAAAAALVIGVVLAQLAGAPSVFDIHTELARQSPVADRPVLWRVARAIPQGTPDLSDAHLTPVAVRQTGTGSVTHYLGPNGCRLSYFRGTRARPRTALPAQMQIAAWRVGDMSHMIVSTGMDRAKFDAIAAHLERLTRQGDPRAPTLLAGVTAAAAPCVG